MDMADHPAVTLQILPFSAGAPSAMGGPFTISRFAEPDLHHVVHVEWHWHWLGSLIAGKASAEPPLVTDDLLRLAGVRAGR